PVNLRDFFEVIFDLVVILDPAPDLIYLLGRNDGAGRASAPQSNGEIPHWPMPLALGAFAGRIPASDIAFHSRTPQGLRHWRKLLGQTLPALAQGQFRQPF